MTISMWINQEKIDIVTIIARKVSKVAQSERFALYPFKVTQQAAYWSYGSKY